MKEQKDAAKPATAQDPAVAVDRFIMQRWITPGRGRIVGGIYDGILLRAGVDFHETYVDMLMPGRGWQRLEQITEGSLPDIKALVDKWLAA